MPSQSRYRVGSVFGSSTIPLKPEAQYPSSQYRSYLPKSHARVLHPRHHIRTLQQVAMSSRLQVVLHLLIWVENHLGYTQLPRSIQPL